MPESVTDRCTKAHEYLFLLSKSEIYFFDNEAIREKAVTDDRPRSSWDKRKETEPTRRGGPSISGCVSRTATLASREGRNRRSVWTVTTKPFKGAHFATFPPDLIEPCILAGCPRGGNVLDPIRRRGNDWNGRGAATPQFRTGRAEP
jgi:site-specific DNA-methyltransferase (adenine-specific)